MVVAPGATVHVPLSDNTEAGSVVQLVDETGAVIDSFFPAPPGVCTSVVNIPVTIRANTSYTLCHLFGNVSPPREPPSCDFRILGSIPPSPRHGVVAGITIGPTPFAAALRYTPDPCFAGTDSFGYDAGLDGQQGVVTVTVLPGVCRVSVHRGTTDCASKTVEYTATNPYSLPAHLVESNSADPGTSKDLVVPAHHTKVISTVTLAGTTTHARVSFTVRGTSHTVLTDEIGFPCPPAAGHPNNPESALAATGAAPTNLAAVGAATIMIGALIMWMVRPRRADIARRTGPRRPTR